MRGERPDQQAAVIELVHDGGHRRSRIGLQCRDICVWRNGRQGNPDSVQLGLITALSMLVSGSVASAVGQDGAAAANAAENETLNNTCGSDDPHGCGKKLGALGGVLGAAGGLVLALLGDEATAGLNVPLMAEEIAGGTRPTAEGAPLSAMRRTRYCRKGVRRRGMDRAPAALGTSRAPGKQ